MILGVFFTCVQAYEYNHILHEHLFFNEEAVNSGLYGSIFFMATGFHGFHVLVGTIFLTVCLIRLLAGDFTPQKHFGFEAAAWYWHFVDVVWLFLFAFVYVSSVDPGHHGQDPGGGGRAIVSRRRRFRRAGGAERALPALWPGAAVCGFSEGAAGMRNLRPGLFDHPDRRRPGQLHHADRRLRGRFLGPGR